MDNLVITSWNMHCTFNSAGPYIHELMGTSDILFLSEHGLYGCELWKIGKIHTDFHFEAKASNNLNETNFGHIPGHGGIAILWRKNINASIRPIPEAGTDRMMVLEITSKTGTTLHVIGVYLPYYGCKISNPAFEFNVLQELILECNGKGETVVIGDTNSHINLGPPRGWGNTTINGKMFMNVMNRCDMVIADLQSIAKGPTFTFHSTIGSSYVDHAAISHEGYELVKRVEVLSDQIINTSDHLAIQLELSVNFPHRTEPITIKNKTAWHKVLKQDIVNEYTVPLEELTHALLTEYGLDTCKILESQAHNVFEMEVDNDVFLQRFTSNILRASNRLPQIKKNKALKPYWDEDLRALSKEKRSARAEWRISGGTRDDTDMAFLRYKEAKKQFRKLIRQKSYAYELKNIQELGETQEVDNTFFWYKVNTQKGKTERANTLFDDNKSLITDPDQIRLEWNTYYEKLYSDDIEYKGDPYFKESVENEVCILSNTVIGSDELEDGCITVDEIYVELSKLKTKKAPGWDGITNEHIKHSGKLTLATLTWIMNKIIWKEKLPISYKRGYIISLPKPNKDKRVKDNNRGITLLTTFYKLLERIIFKREKPWLNDHDVMDEIQGGGREKISCLHTSYLVQEAVAENTERGSNVFVAFLDIKKAFDSVWLPGFLLKLHRAGMRPKPWKIIYDAYQSFQCAALVDGSPGTWFNVKRGVHQGAPLSMPLYQVYINEMIIELRKSIYGIQINSIDVTSPAHADDIAVMALYKVALNHLLNIVYQHSVVWNFDYNIDKCVVLLWGKDIEPNVPIMLGPGQLNIVKTCKHMGVTLSTDNNEQKEIRAKRISAGKGVMYAARGLGSHTLQMPPKVLSKIYWAVAVPRMTYGLDVTPINNSDLNELDKAHRYNAKVIQNLPQNTPTPAPLATIGWLTLAAHIAILKLCFMWRVLCLPDNNIYKRVMISVLRKCTQNGVTLKKSILSPTVCMYNCAKKYGMDEYLLNCLEEGNFGVLNANKTLVKKIISEQEYFRWRATCFLYSSLSVYMSAIDKIAVHTWWIFANKFPHLLRKISSVVALLCGTQPKSLQCFQTMCKLCQSRQPDSIEHTLFVCESLKSTRIDHLRKISASMPIAMNNEFSNMTPHRKVVFLLSGLSAAYTWEWTAIYSNIANFVYEMYRERFKYYEQISENPP